jgi:hypothetical protein
LLLADIDHFGVILPHEFAALLMISIGANCFHLAKHHYYSNKRLSFYKTAPFIQFGRQ